MVVGLGGWLQFQFVFAGRNLAGEDRIYAVVRYRFCSMPKSLMQ